MDDNIEERLHDTSKTCFECYQAWANDKKGAEPREKLLEAIHELRKVASRLEIELAVSERDEMTKTPIPIPPHRDAHKRKGQKGGNEKNGNRAQPDSGADEAGSEQKVEIKKRTPRRKKAAGD